MLLNATGRCGVPSLVGQALGAARKAIGLGNCRLGKVSGVYSKSIKKGRVLSQKPAAGAVLPKGTRIVLIVSRGAKR